MSAQLALTALDRRVLSQLERGRPGRASEIVNFITRTWAAPTEQEIAEVRGILRGAEHLGLVRCNRGGWWTITDAGRRALAEGSIPA